MDIDKLLTQLQQAGITLKVADSGDSLKVTSTPGAMTDEFRTAIKENKQDLIIACCCKIVEYERDNLLGEMPKCYQVLPDGKILALYRSLEELGDHVFRVVTKKHGFARAVNLVDAACALGGIEAPTIQEPGDQFPF